MAWYQIKERGSMFGYWFIYYLRLIMGYRVTIIFLHFIVLYYFLFAVKFKRAVRTFLNRATGQCRTRQIYQTFYNFAVSIIDRMFFLHGEAHTFSSRIHNIEIVDELVNKKQGAFLLGSHFGPMEAARLYAENRGYTVSALIYTAISPRLFHFLKKVNPDFENSLIQVQPNSIDYILDVKNRLDDGGFVAILGDRPWRSGKVTPVDFLGQKASFPVGAYEMALSLGCPIILTFVIKTGFKQYDIFFEKLSDGEYVPRKFREEKIKKLVACYVKRLEYYAKSAPTQWYNFYDYWETEHV